MPNEMNHAEVAESLEFIRADGEVGNAITLTQLGLNTLSDAATDERRIANGELVEVVHARWVNMPFNVDNDKYGMNKYNMRIKCTNCGFVTSSELKYAHCPVCGALVGGKDGEPHDHN